MRKRFIVLFVFSLACILCLAGCASSSGTVMLISVSTFFSNDALIEATARELTIDGDKATVRISVVNLGSDPLDSFSADVSFLDSEGNVLYTDTQSVAFDEPLGSYESASFSASCTGKDAKKAVAISIAGSRS